MGCGSSSLKGEKVDTVNAEPAEQPIKRVRTNFSDVDFTGDGNGTRRGKSFAVAPDEDRRPTRISETYSEDPIPTLPHEGASARDGEKLAPYHTIDNDQGLNSPELTSKTPHINQPTTSVTQQDPFSSSTLPISNSTYQEPIPSQNEKVEERKQSWYARAQDRIANRNVSQISDEEIQRQFGMTRPEWEAYMKDPRNGVGAHAKVGNLPMTSMTGGGMGM